MCLYKLACVLIMATATVKGIVYLGCYQDYINKRVLDKELTDSNSNAPQACARRCSDYRYAGVEYWTKCFCGNTLNTTPQQEKVCTYRCPGDSKYICGDLWKISVYTNWVTACGPQPDIANGYATLGMGSNLTYGSIADVNCYTGFIGKPTITCLSITSWEKATCKQPGTTSSAVTPTTSTTQHVQTTVTTAASKQQASKGTTRSPVTPTTSTTQHVQTTVTTAASKQQASKGSTTTAVAAGVSVTVTLAVAAVVIVLMLRNKKKSCFANTKRSNLENKDDDHHISLQNRHEPGAPAVNHTYSGLDTGNRKSKEHDASAFTNVTYQNTNSKHGNHVSEAHAYFVLEKDGLGLQRNDANSTQTDVHDYFVLEKQQPHFGNRNGVSLNEVHPYFVLEKEGDQPVHDRPPNEANPYFVLEKQNTSNPTQLHTAHALDLENTDGDKYQKIDTDDTYADIDDSREDNNDYDYTNKAFKDSRTEISDNVYNHLNAAVDEYYHVGKGQSNVKAMENNYAVTSSVV